MNKTYVQLNLNKYNIMYYTIYVMLKKEYNIYFSIITLKKQSK